MLLKQLAFCRDEIVLGGLHMGVTIEIWLPFVYFWGDFGVGLRLYLGLSFRFWDFGVWNPFCIIWDHLGPKIAIWDRLGTFGTI